MLDFDSVGRMKTLLSCSFSVSYISAWSVCWCGVWCVECIFVYLSVCLAVCRYMVLFICSGNYRNKIVFRRTHAEWGRVCDNRSSKQIGWLNKLWCAVRLMISIIWRNVSICSHFTIVFLTLFFSPALPISPHVSVDMLISSALALSCYLFDLSAFCIHTMFSSADHDVRGRRLFECAKLIHFDPIKSNQRWMDLLAVLLLLLLPLIISFFSCSEALFAFFNNCRLDRVCLRNWWPSLPVPYSRKFDWSTCLTVAVCSLIPFNQYATER